jgi:hypothetical protein
MESNPVQRDIEHFSKTNQSGTRSGEIRDVASRNDGRSEARRCILRRFPPKYRKRSGTMAQPGR